MTPRHKGAFAEYKFITKAISFQLNALLPAVEGQAYDCVIDNGRKFFKVQVKFAVRDKRRNDTHCVMLERRTSRKKGQAVEYKPEEVDFYAVYIATKDVFYIIPYYVPNVKSITITNNNNNFTQYLENWDQLL